MIRRYALLAVQAVVTLALLWVLFRGFDWAAFRSTLAQLSPVFYAGAVSALTAGFLLYAWRWHAVLGGMGLAVSYRDVVRQSLIGIFFGNLMPSAVGGDAAKVYYLGRRVGYVQVGASVLVDRFLGFLWLSVLGAGLAWTVGAPTPMLVFNRNLLSGFALVFVTMLAAIWIVPINRLVPGFMRRGRLAPAVSWVEDLAGAVRLGGCRPRTLAISGAVVLSYIVLMSVVYQRYFAASGGVVPGLLMIMNAIVSMSVLINVPISVNGIGLREQLHYLLFAEMGLSKEVSVSLSLLVFSYSLVLSVVGYVLWLRLRPEAKQPA